MDAEDIWAAAMVGIGVAIATKFLDSKSVNARSFVVALFYSGVLGTIWGNHGAENRYIWYYFIAFIICWSLTMIIIRKK